MSYSASTNWSNEESYLNGLIANGSTGQQAWAKNQLGVLNAAKQSYSPVNIDSSIGSFVNALDVITAQSDKASARSLDYAKQNQEWSANQAAIANEINAAEAAKNRDWQEYMSNTAHQREVADLKAAGLNPVLSAMGGNGASVGSGAAASAVMPSGASGQSDTSANGALVSLLGSMLSAQTSIQNQLVSARTQEAVADKYTAMSELTSRIAAAASMSNAATAAEASKYGSEMQYNIRKDFPESVMGVLNSILQDSGMSYSGLADSAFGQLLNFFGFSDDSRSSRSSKSGKFGSSGKSGSFGGK